MVSPFPYIPELKGLGQLRTFNDILILMGVVFSTVPWCQVPYTGVIQYELLENLYLKFRSFEIGGWCGLNAEFFKWLVEGYRRPDFASIRYRSYNFGFAHKNISHIGVIVELDGREYFFDPYFARYFVHSEGYPIQFKDLLYLIRERKFDRYQSRFLPVLKPVLRENGVTEYVLSQQLMFEVNQVFTQWGLYRLLDQVFGNKNFDSLMLIKIPD